MLKEIHIYGDKYDVCYIGQMVTWKHLLVILIA